MKKILLFALHFIVSVSTLILLSKISGNKLNKENAILTTIITLFGVMIIPKGKRSNLFFIVQLITTIILSLGIYLFFEKILN